MSRLTIHRPARRGVMLLYVALFGVVLIAFASLAADFGRVQLVKAELQRAADASARAGAAGLPSVSSTENLAVQYAGLNTADGTPVELKANQDIEMGTWDPATRTFSVLSGSSRSIANAVRVTCRRVHTRQNATPLLFASVLGQKTCDVEASAVASMVVAGYGMIGLESIKMAGNTSAGYWSNSGTTYSNYGSIASNGNITLSGSTMVYGDARPGMGKSVNGGSSRVAGTTSPLSSPLSFPNGDAGIYATQNDNVRILGGFVTSGPDLKVGSGKTATIPAGNYYFKDVDISSGGLVSFTGPATIYCFNNFTLNGNAVVNGNLPKNLKIVMCPNTRGEPPGNIKVNSGSALYADIYAPQSDIALSGSGSIYGSILGKKIDVTGTADIYYDLALNVNNGVRLVK